MFGCREIGKREIGERKIENRWRFSVVWRRREVKKREIREIKNHLFAFSALQRRKGGQS